MKHFRFFLRSFLEEIALTVFMARIYVDTNVYLDFFFDRKDKLRPLGDFAFEVFKKTASCQFSIILSDWLEKEIRNNGTLQQFNDLKNELQHKIILVKTTKEDIKQARKSEHFEDTLHAVLAKKAKAEFIVTRNIKHFEDSEVIPVYPESL